MLLAQGDTPKTIRVVGLEDDADNKTVEAPADLGPKPETLSVPADAIMKKAVESVSSDALIRNAEAAGVQAEAKSGAANVKSLTIEGTVIPPSSEDAKTLEEAVRWILRDAKKQIGTVSSNGIEKLVMPYQQLGDGKSYEIEWRKALRLLLTPVGYNFTEDGELVLFGLADEVDIKHKQLAQERLLSNRTPILFTTNESEGGMELRTAIRDVAVKADITITTDYMEQSDLYVPVQTVAAEGKIGARCLSEDRVVPLVEGIDPHEGARAVWGALKRLHQQRDDFARHLFGHAAKGVVHGEECHAVGRLHGAILAHPRHGEGREEVPRFGVVAVEPRAVHEPGVMDVEAEGEAAPGGKLRHMAHPGGQFETRVEVERRPRRIDWRLDSAF